MSYFVPPTSTHWYQKNVNTAQDNLQTDSKGGIMKSICKICTCWPSVHQCRLTLSVPTWKRRQSATDTNRAPSEIRENCDSCCREEILIPWVRGCAASTCCPLCVSGGASLSSGHRQTDSEQPAGGPRSTELARGLFQALPKSRAAFCSLPSVQKAERTI